MDKLRQGIERLKKEVAPGFEYSKTPDNWEQMSIKERGEWLDKAKENRPIPNEYKSFDGKVYTGDEALKKAQFDYDNTDIRKFPVGSDEFNLRKSQLINAINFIISHRK